MLDVLAEDQFRVIFENTDDQAQLTDEYEDNN